MAQAGDCPEQDGMTSWTFSGTGWSSARLKSPECRARSFSERAALLAKWYSRIRTSCRRRRTIWSKLPGLRLHRIAAGGEGLVIRLADAPGQVSPDDIPAGRWKIKSSETSEGEVISSAGFRLVVRENGVDVILRMSAAAAEADGVPQVGEIVEFKFSRRSPRGVPLNAGYLRRRDIHTLPAAAAAA